MRDGFLISIGREMHVNREEHRMPLIAPTTKYDHILECGRTDYM